VSTTTLAYIFIGIAVFQRLAEVVYAQMNTRALLKRGATEVGRNHYPVMIALHVSWLVAVVVLLPKPPPIYWTPVVIMCLTQFVRLWVLHTLGPYWTTRIITLPGAPVVTRGPYRFMRHPNYAVVVIEIAAFPLVFGEVAVAIVFSILNAAMLFWRIREEDSALANRRVLADAR
jgi:methyltransferase